MQSNLNSKLILGTVQMGLPYGINNAAGKISFEDSCKILNHAYANGIKILDSAEAYGDAHHVIGRFHRRNPDKIFKIITKLPHDLNTDIEEKVNQYLNDLEINHLHALLFHSFSSYKDNSDNMEVLKRLKAEKKIKFIGVSVYTNDEVREVTLNDSIDIIQLPFNLLDNSNLRGDVLEAAKLRGKIIHTRSALLQGLFFKNMNDDAKIVQSLHKELMYILGITTENNITIAELALGYCLRQSTIDNVLVGVDSLKQLKDNILAIRHHINPEIINEINTIKVKDLKLLNPSLWH